MKPQYLGITPHHDVKLWPEHFNSYAIGRPSISIRPNDRAYQVGDLLACREWNPHTAEYSGSTVFCQVCAVHNDPSRLPEGHVALVLDVLMFTEDAD